MPAMPRVSGKSKRIAFQVLGIPPNMRKEKLKKRKQDKRLLHTGLRLVK